MQVRNPWGAEGYSGLWSDKVSNANGAMIKEELSHVAKDDGVYWIPFADYLTSFEETMISTDNSGWSHGAFVKLNDQSADPSTKKAKHTLTVTSETDQRVWIAGNTWDYRGLKKSCQDH